MYVFAKAEVDANIEGKVMKAHEKIILVVNVV